MWKTVLAGTAALSIAATTAALAQRPEASRRGPPTAEDVQAFADARLASLRAGLSLTEAQAKNWPAFEQAVREWQKVRAERIAQRRNEPAPQSAEPAERLRRQGTTMADTGAAMKKLADALDPLYKSLDDNQKRRFAALGGLRVAFAGRGGGDEGRPGFRGRDDRDSRDHRSGRHFHGQHGHHHGRGRGGNSPEDYRRGRSG